MSISDVELFFKRKGEISLWELTENKTYQERFINYVSSLFLDEDTQTKLIEVIALMDPNSSAIYEIINKIYNKFTKDEDRQLSSIEKNKFVNKISSYLKKNTKLSDDETFEIITKVFDSLTTVFSFEEDLDLIFSDDNFNYLNNEKTKIKKNTLHEERTSGYNSTEEKIKNLNPTKVAKFCINNGIPKNINELTNNIKKNKSFPIALMISMANIVSVMEFKKEMNKEKRTNYLKILKLIEEKDMKLGVRKLIDNFKKMSSSDRVIIRFFHIWKAVIDEYKNMSDYHKKIIIDIFIEDTKENIDNFIISNEDYNKNKVENIKNDQLKDKKELNFSEIKGEIFPDKVKIENIAEAFADNQNITDKVLDIMKREPEKYYFIKKIIENINNRNLDKNISDEKIKFNLLGFYKIVTEIPVEEYEKSISFLLKNYYEISGRLLTYKIKIINNKVLIEVLTNKYGEDSPEIKFYTNLTNKIIINKKYIE